MLMYVNFILFRNNLQGISNIKSKVCQSNLNSGLCTWMKCVNSLFPHCRIKCFSCTNGFLTTSGTDHNI